MVERRSISISVIGHLSDLSAELSRRSSSRAPRLDPADAFGNAARSRAEPEQQLASEHRSSAILDVLVHPRLRLPGHLETDPLHERVGAGLAIGEAHLDRGV